MSAASAQEASRREFDALCLPAFASRALSRPFVIALEGPNGAGKTALCAALSQRLRVPSCLGVEAAWFAEDFKVRMIRDAAWFSSAMFFLSGCIEQMRTLSRCDAPLVIMDRSIWSTLAVHAAASADRLSALLEMLRPFAAQIQVPDFVLVLDASFETCQGRIARKSGAARSLDELTAQPEFHACERAFYHWLASQRAAALFLDTNQRDAAAVAAAAEAMIRGRPEIHLDS